MTAPSKSFVSIALQADAEPFLEQIKSGLWPTRLFRHIAGLTTAAYLRQNGFVCKLDSTAAGKNLQEAAFEPEVKTPPRG
ncbi:hypothetical protein [Granulicella rosea]|uniref:hypothetical protein n=1 Tax=Granulicella rosea TaxID=474952 RepID=UPI001C3DB5A2|nr:hypothetical protein [Granulicella rosea]